MLWEFLQDLVSGFDAFLVLLCLIMSHNLPEQISLLARQCLRILFTRHVVSLARRTAIAQIALKALIVTRKLCQVVNRRISAVRGHCFGTGHQLWPSG